MVLTAIPLGLVVLGAWLYPWTIIVDGRREKCWPAVVIGIPHDPGGSDGHERRAYDACSKFLVQREFPVAMSITGASILIFAGVRRWTQRPPPRPDRT